MRACVAPASVAARAFAVLALAAGLLATAPALTAQTAGRAGAERSELSALAAEAEATAASASDAKIRERSRETAAAIRRRLSRGDFEVGDRIVLVFPGDTTLNDTLLVEQGRTVRLPMLGPLALDTVLRSELHAHLARSIGRFLKDTTFAATPLVRIGVLGEVAEPGYYHIAPSATVSDALMVAGGPTSEADVPGTVVRRGARVVMSKRAVRRAMVAGSTLDQLGLGAGDELVVAERRERGLAFYAQIAAVATGALVAVRALR